MTKPIPDGYNTVSPYLAVDDAAAAIEYYERAFGAEETMRMNGPDGKVGHAELKIGDSHVMLSDPFPQSSTSPPKELGGTTFYFVDDGIESALEQGRAAAEDQDVVLGGGASVAQQYLRAGLLDELRIHVAPILLGGGVSLFGELGTDAPRLELTKVAESPFVTHLTYDVEH